MFPILSNFSLSYLCSCWLGYFSHHPRLLFFPLIVFHCLSNISSRDLREISGGSKVEFKIKAIKAGIKFLT